MRRATLPLLMAILILPLATADTGTEVVATGLESASQTWTVMMYMADDYIIDLPWQQNLADMQAADQASWTNIIALIDLPGPNNSMLLKIRHGSNSTINDSNAVIPPTGEVNMASPDTLRAFVNFSAAAYPADRYVLFLWGHADTWIGMCPDGGDILTLPELSQALAGAKSDIGRPLDLVAVDACSVASVEMLFELDGLTQFFAGSENDIPFEGLPYRQILSGLASDRGQSAADFGSTIVREYTDWARFNSTYSSTMALFNMSRLAPFKECLESLALQGARYDSLFHDVISLAFHQTERYLMTPWYVDFGDLLSRLVQADVPPELALAALNAFTSYSEIVEDFEAHDLPGPIDNMHVIRGTGAVIFAPSSVLPDTMYANLSIASSSWYAFGRLARHSGATNASGEGPTLSLNQTAYPAPPSVYLKWPAGLSSVQAWVFRQAPGGLVFLGAYGSDTGQLLIEGLVGNLVFSASGMQGTEVTSHALLDVTVPVSVNLNITLLSDGRPARSAYDVRVVVDGASYSIAAEDGYGRLALNVPAQADVNSLVQIQVLEKGTGNVLGVRSVLMQTADMTVAVEIFPGAAGAGSFPWPLLPIAVLPGTLMLIYAVLLWHGYRKKDKAREKDDTGL